VKVTGFNSVVESNERVIAMALLYDDGLCGVSRWAKRDASLLGQTVSLVAGWQASSTSVASAKVMRRNL